MSFLNYRNESKKYKKGLKLHVANIKNWLFLRTYWLCCRCFNEFDEFAKFVDVTGLRKSFL